MKFAALAFIAIIAASPMAFAEEAKVYEMKLENHAFTPANLAVPAGKNFKIKLSNLDDTPAEFESKQLRFEKVVAGKKAITVSVKALKPGTYGFYDEYHEDVATGTVTAQ